MEGQSVDLLQARNTIPIFRRAKNQGFNDPTMRRGPIIAVIAVITLLAALAGWWCVPANNPVQYHLGQIQSLRSSMGFAPKNWKDYFQPRTWRWYWRGRKPIEQTLKEIGEHQKELIRLGYFEQREFVLTRRRLDSTSRNELQTILGKAPLSCSYWSYSTTGGDPVNALTVTTTPTDMKIWSNVIADFDAKGAK